MQPKWIIYTDLDGTLLDFSTYSYQEAIGSVEKLKEQNIPVVFCSSKTRAEQQVFRQALQLRDPFIVENGSAIFVPDGYTDIQLTDLPEEVDTTTISTFQVIELGSPATIIRQNISQVREDLNLEVMGYADLTTEEVCRITGLDKPAAERAATRDYSETILTGDVQSDKFTKFVDALAEKGLSCVSGGKFHTVVGSQSDKGKAVKLLSDLFRQTFDSIQTAGLGDSANDLPLLSAVDYPFLVKKYTGQWQDIQSYQIVKIDGIGPTGWNMAISEYVLK